MSRTTRPKKPAKGKLFRLWKPKPYGKLVARSKRLEVRPYTAADYEAWREGHAGRKKKQHRFDGDKPRAAELTRAKFRAMLDSKKKGARAGHYFGFGVFELGTGRVVGHVGMNLIHRGMRWVNLGYGIHNQHWGNGYGPEAARLCMEIGFGSLDLHRIEASCDTGNLASAKTALRAGLVKEGLRRKANIPGGPVDTFVFAQNCLDWSRQRRAAKEKKKKRARR